MKPVWNQKKVVRVVVEVQDGLLFPLLTEGGRGRFFVRWLRTEKTGGPSISIAYSSSLRWAFECSDEEERSSEEATGARGGRSWIRRSLKKDYHEFFSSPQSEGIFPASIRRNSYMIPHLCLSRKSNCSTNNCLAASTFFIPPLFSSISRMFCVTWIVSSRFPPFPLPYLLCRSFQFDDIVQCLSVLTKLLLYQRRDADCLSAEELRWIGDIINNGLSP